VQKTIKRRDLAIHCYLYNVYTQRWALCTTSCCIVRKKKKLY